MTKRILELRTGLYPDTATLGAALASAMGDTDVTRLDVSALAPDDERAWEAAAEAILAADVTVTA
jgi:hypothetical protein